MTLLRASLITGLATVVRVASGLVLNKIFAVYIGPAGLAQIAQLGTLAGVVNGVATGGITVGVTRYVAEHRDRQRSAALVSTALVVVSVAAAASSLGLIAFSVPLAQYILGNASHAWVMWVLAGTNVVTAFNALIVAVLNGRKEVNLIAAIGVAGSLLSLLVASWLTLGYGLEGALAAACLAPALPALALGAYLVLHRRREPMPAFVGPDAGSVSLLARYSLMTLTAAIAGPTSVLLVRDHIADALSWEAAGHWQGVWKISEVYLTLVTSSLAVYFLPRLAELREHSDIRRELRNGLSTAVPIAATAALTIYLLRHWITVNLFAESFLPMVDLFAFQLLGDILKISSWVIAYLMLAKAMVRAYILTEIIFSASFAGLAIVLVWEFGLVGVTYAYFTNYLFYLIAVAAIVYRHVRLPEARRPA